MRPVYVNNCEGALRSTEQSLFIVGLSNNPSAISMEVMETCMSRGQAFLLFEYPLTARITR
jgi:hypothetical protein